MLKELTQKKMEEVNGGDFIYNLGDYVVKVNFETQEVIIINNKTNAVIDIIKPCEQPCPSTSTTTTTSSGPTGPSSGSSYSGPDYSNPSSPPYAV